MVRDAKVTISCIKITRLFVVGSPGEAVCLLILKVYLPGGLLSLGAPVIQNIYALFHASVNAIRIQPILG